VLVKLKLQHPHPGIPWAFDCAMYAGRGEFERCLGRVGNLNRIYLLFWRNTPVSFFSVFARFDGFTRQNFAFVSVQLFQKGLQKKFESFITAYLSLKRVKSV